MSAPSTSINGGELASLIVAITGVGYFIVNLLRKPKAADEDCLKLLAASEKARGSQSRELAQLREFKRSQLRR